MSGLLLRVVSNNGNHYKSFQDLLRYSILFPCSPFLDFPTTFKINKYPIY